MTHTQKTNEPSTHKMPSQDEVELCERVDTYNDILSFGNDLKAKLHSPSTPNGASSPTSLLSNGYQHTHNGSGCNNSQQCWPKVCYRPWHRDTNESYFVAGRRMVAAHFFTLVPFHRLPFGPSATLFAPRAHIDRMRKNELAIFFADLDLLRCCEQRWKTM